MPTPSDVTDNAARTSASILHTLLDNHHPRNYSIRLWDGSTLEAERGHRVRFTMTIQHPSALRTMFLRPSERSLGEAFIYNDFDIEGDLESAFSMAEYLLGLHLSASERLRLATQLLKLPANRTSRAGRQPAHLEGKIHSVERDRGAVTYHYNTSNEFFSLFLDKRMIYSCAYFQKPNESLDSAQQRKLEYICRKLRLNQGDRFLDIGCGWGALVMYAAKRYNVSALGITLSEPQAKLANERIRQEHLSDRCRVEVRDYREIDPLGPFDKLASIGMVEHVGEQKLPEYFDKTWSILRPGGAFLNHGIAYPPDPATNLASSFSQAYVFPDGNPVSISASTKYAERAGFEVRDIESLREHYALTLRHWVRRLEAHRQQAVKATDEATYRTWRLFMAASARAFSTGQYNVFQSLLVKPDNGKSGLPLTRADWYKR